MSSLDASGVVDNKDFLLNTTYSNYSVYIYIHTRTHIIFDDLKKILILPMAEHESYLSLCIPGCLFL